MTHAKSIFVLTLPTVCACKNKEELMRQVTEVNKSLADFYRSLPDDMLMAEAFPDGWSVKRNMKHVISTNSNFAKWFNLPNFILKLFPKPKPNQPDPKDLIVTNRKGLTNYGKYTKGARPHPEMKEKLLNSIIESAEILNKAIAARSEEELDTLPAPFGKMNLRCFAYFLLKHNIHHTNVVRIRLES